MLLTVGILSCKKGPGLVRSYGKDATITRKLESFKSIVAGEKFVLTLTQDTSIPEQIQITYGSNLLDRIETKVESGVLTVADNNTFNWVRDLNVKPLCAINVHSLEKLELRGSAKVLSTDTIRSKRITIIMNSVEEQELFVDFGILDGYSDNPGNITLHGHSDIIAWTCENGSYLDAGDMTCGDAYIYHYTTRDVRVNPKNIFKAYLFNKGNVYYKEDPKFVFIKEETGEGRVIKQP